ncbi:MAG TPA: transcriptional repressor [Candidatus Nanoarchaeia archaeon]|nr:transcriptional repressor [Candidatus Nanoarchaeia archaeon]
MKRATLQKKLIEQELQSFSSFFTAEDLYHKVAKKNPSLGIATIYRFLNELTKEGTIHTYLCNRKTLYSNSKKNHCHFTCEKCGEKKHITIQKLDFVKEQIDGELCHFQVDITGICKKCLN